MEGRPNKPAKVKRATLAVAEVRTSSGNSLLGDKTRRSEDTEPSFDELFESIREGAERVRQDPEAMDLIRRAVARMNSLPPREGLQSFDDR